MSNFKKTFKSFFENTITSALKSCIVNSFTPFFIIFKFFFGIKLFSFRAAHILKCLCPIAGLGIQTGPFHSIEVLTSYNKG